MLVNLKRDFFVGDYFFSAKRDGLFVPAEIPSTIDGLEVVTFDKRDPAKKQCVLPRDVVILAEAPVAKPAKVEANTLSQMGKGSTAKTFNDAMKDDA